MGGWARLILLQALADQLSIKWGWLWSLGLWGSEPSVLASTPGRNEEDESEAPIPDRLLDALFADLCQRIPRQWRELRAVEMVVEEIEEEFGEDPLLPELRDILTNVRATVADLHTQARDFEPDLDDLPEPDHETLDSSRRLAYRQVPDKRP